VVVLAELTAESPAVPVDDVPLVELPLVAADTLVTPGPVDNPGEVASPQAARTRAARVSRRITLQL
jgi:hypothetical protein